MKKISEDYFNFIKKNVRIITGEKYDILDADAFLFLTFRGFTQESFEEWRRCFIRLM